MKFLIITTTLLFSQFSTAGLALETASFSVIEKKSLELGKKYGNKNVLVVLDIDNTLLVMPQNFGSDQWFTWQLNTCIKKKSRASHCVSNNMGGLLSLNTQIFANSKMNTTEKIFIDLSNNTYETCPISQEEFTNSDIILKINHCGHIFKKESLLNWFNTNSKCPVCRHDISTNSNNTVDLSNNILNNVSLDLSNNNFTNLINRNLTNVLDGIGNAVLNNMASSVGQVLNNPTTDLSNNQISTAFQYSFQLPNINLR